VYEMVAFTLLCNVIAYHKIKVPGNIKFGYVAMAWCFYAWNFTRDKCQLEQYPVLYWFMMYKWWLYVGVLLTLSFLACVIAGVVIYALGTNIYKFGIEDAVAKLLQTTAHDFALPRDWNHQEMICIVWQKVRICL